MTDNIATLDGLHAQLRRTMGPHWQLKILAKMAWIIDRAWVDPSSNPTEASAVVGAEERVPVVAPDCAVRNRHPDGLYPGLSFVAGRADCQPGAASAAPGL